MTAQHHWQRLVRKALPLAVLPFGAFLALAPAHASLFTGVAVMALLSLGAAVGAELGAATAEAALQDAAVPPLWAMEPAADHLREGSAEALGPARRSAG